MIFLFFGILHKVQKGVDTLRNTPGVSEDNRGVSQCVNRQMKDA